LFTAGCQAAEKTIFLFAYLGGRRPVGKPRGRWEDVVGWMPQIYYI
jgi:hypothetical protein